MTDAVIVLKAGSSSLKFGVHGIDATKTLPPSAAARSSTCEAIRTWDKNGKPLDVPAWGEGQTIDHKTALQFVIT